MEREREGWKLVREEQRVGKERGKGMKDYWSPKA